MGNFFWEATNVQGRRTFDIPVAGVTQKSIVLASVTEIKIPQGSEPGSPKNDPFLGAATGMTVRNIVPLTNGIVRIVIDTDWNNGPISIRISGSVMGDV